MRKRSKIEAGRREQLALGLTAACSVALSDGVIASLIYLLLAFASSMASPPAFAQTAHVGAGVRLEAGIEKEDVDGDLKSAMDIYQKIAADTSAPRDVRAKALLRLAGCDEKLGKQAKQVYEQIVRDYADQPPAAQARKRLAFLNQQEHPALPTTMTVRKIEWAGLGRMAEMDTDGERATYVASDGNLYFSDLAGHSKRLIFKGEPNLSGLGWMVSRDFSLVALAPPVKPGQQAKLAVTKIDGTGYRELLRDDAEGRILGGNNGFGMDWSWDDRNLLIHFSSGPNEPSRLWLVSSADGQRRELTRTEGNIQKPVFSPDGHYVAYEVWPKDPMSIETSRIFVVPAEGGEPRLAYESGPGGIEPGPSGFDVRLHLLKDWTADGRFLAIKDVRQGKSALYLLPIKNGVATGPAEFVRYGEFESAYTTASGALVYEDPGTKPVHVGAFLASLYSDGHLGSWKHLDLRSRLDDGVSPWPSFSPDGNQIAYLAGDVDPARQDIVLQDLATGRERVLYQSASKTLRCQFSASNPKVFCTVDVGDGANGKTELISIAVESGSVELIAAFEGTKVILQSPQDDKIFYFLTRANTLRPLVRWDRSTQLETALSALGDNFHGSVPSFDGRWLVRILDDGTLQVQSISGGDWRSLVSGLTNYPETTPDGKWILYHSFDPEGKPSLFRVPIDGGDPQRLGDYPISDLAGNTLRISPDGSKILASAGERAHYDLWVLDNFEPPVKK